MRARLIKGDSWADVYREGTFGGRGRRLAPGERARIREVGSIIVGPSATVVLTNRRGQEVLKLPPLKLVADVSRLKLVERASHLFVAGTTF